MKTPSSPGAQPSLASVPQFVRYLSTFPPSQRVLDALFRGPLSHLQGRMGQLYQLQGGDLVSLAFVGPPRSVGDRHMVLPLDVDMPMTRAVKANEVVPVPIVPFRRELVLELDQDVWEEAVKTTGAETVVNVPLTYAGTLVGALGFAMSRAWNAAGIDPIVVEAIRGPLALWLTHPMAGLAEVPQSAREWSLTLSARQCNVLRRVRAGESTALIASHLGFSESTIKQDLLRAMKSMRTNDRMVAAERAEALGLLVDLR